METAALLIVLMSGQGYWFGGAAGEIAVRWVAEPAPRGLMLHWALFHGGVRLADGETRLRTGNGVEAATIRIQPPIVRTRTAMQWRYRLIRGDDGEVVGGGSEWIHVFPADLLNGVAAGLMNRRLVVWDVRDEWRSVLDELKVPYVAVERGQRLQTVLADVIIVASEQLDDSVATQATLLRHAQAGASVLIMPQTRRDSLAGYSLLQRSRPANLEWREEHVLFASLSSEDRQSWLESISDVRAIQLPTDEPALELAWWPVEVAANEPGPIDALAVTRRIGTGRIVLWQIPLGHWRDDPRTQVFIANMLEYLATRPEPTPPPSRRLRELPLGPAAPVPTITVPPGDRP
jgi:hypothetical protein